MITYESGTVSGAIGLDDPTSFLGELTQNFIDISSWRKMIASPFSEPMKDLCSDGPPLSLSQLRLLFFTLASTSSACCCCFHFSPACFFSSSSFSSPRKLLIQTQLYYAVWCSVFLLLLSAMLLVYMSLLHDIMRREGENCVFCFVLSERERDQSQRVCVCVLFKRVRISYFEN